MTTFRFGFFLILLFLLHANFLKSSEADSTEPKEKKGGMNKLFSGIKNLFNKKKDAGTEDTVKKDVTLSEDAVKEILTKASSAIANQKYEDVVDLCSQVLEAQPNNTFANKFMGSSLVILNQTKSAESFLYTAIENSAWKDLTPIYYLAESYRKQGEYDLAEKVVMKGLNEIEGKVDKTGYFALMLGTIHQSRQNYSVAADWYLMAAMQQVNNTELWYKASTLEFPPENQDLLFAQNVLAEGVKMNPLSFDLIFQLGAVLQQNQKPDEAIMLYETLLAAYANDGKSDDQDTTKNNENNAMMNAIYGNLATALHNKGDMDKAKTYYEKAVENANYHIGDSNGILVANYAILLCSMQLWDEAFTAVGIYEQILIQLHGDSKNKKESHHSDDIARAMQYCVELKEGRTPVEETSSESISSDSDSSAKTEEL